jgi:hypothetical protein
MTENTNPTPRYSPYLSAWVGKGACVHLTRPGSGVTLCGKPAIEDKEDKWLGSTTCYRCERSA